ncbi:HotDog domain-containing protein [Phascolomyces articulosus]|uniref:HotDog domain-containing protein n=1 Tax=Phascolomyces articulosus TaxID=60185 RepID=A0AAD5K4B1_9FUNG|nr:HotDog domain-containing protein [Phascolomyces articulosus]
MKVNPDVVKNFPRIYELIIKFTEYGIKTPTWQEKITDEISIVDAEPNKLVWEYKPRSDHCNPYQTVHGGCVATVIDVCSSIAILTHNGKVRWLHLGITTSLSITYFRGIRSGQTTRIECNVLHVGKTLATVATKIYDQDGNLCYTGIQTKYCTDDRPKL